jgi:hypothetical protein
LPTPKTRGYAAKLLRAGILQMVAEEKAKRDPWLLYSSVVLGASALAVAVLGATSGGDAGSIVEGGIAGLVLAAAAAAGGGFLGFLFAIPRSKQNLAPAPNPNNGGSRGYDENTNLEQISDWLTKIIVGVSLVQAESIARTAYRFAWYYGPAIYAGEDPRVSAVITLAIMIYFTIGGFLVLYLLTRIHLEGALLRTSAVLKQEIESITVSQQREQSQKDSDALALVEEFLDPKSDPAAPMFANITKVVEESSLIARTLIFNRAQQVRKANWRSADDKPMVERTVRVFRGLVAGSGSKNHRNHGQLGYALKDQPKPDWAGAAAALRKAIEMRGGAEDSGTGFYEFNLAVCLINLDPDFQNGKPSTAERKKEIAGLLDAGRKQVDLTTEKSVVGWAKLNDYAI